MQKLTLKDLDLKNKKVLMRVDFNVPLKNGKISDDTRIKKTLPSIKYILNNEASLILMSHMGRPKGKREDQLSLKIVADRLEKLLNKKVIFVKDSIGKEVEKLAKNLKEGEILLLENLRFHEAEEKPGKDEGFAKSLASLADIYVNDAFGTSHRKHSSTYEIAKYFKDKAVAGFLLEKEINFLGNAIRNPKRPFYAIIGGSKISSKINVLLNLINKVDALFIGGGMSYTFLKAKGVDIANSIVELDQIDSANKIMEKCKNKNVALHLAKDIVIADDMSDKANIKTINSSQNFDENFEGVDIGEKTINEWIELLKKAKTILWNGPLGVFEIEKFANGTNKIALAISKMDAITIIGGGDSVAAINNLNLEDEFSHISTGGGASLEYIEFGTLPGIEVLSDK
ncbi:MAG: Bifunctional PGK/TIM [Candidatus Anoxychlamydiales bacterium]|nr:Bifunctional PGK/TIM [Candidatus Anoxychlamydiales bacterium]